MTLIRVTAAVLFLAGMAATHAWCLDTGNYIASLIMFLSVIATVALLGILRLS